MFVADLYGTPFGGCRLLGLSLKPSTYTQMELCWAASTGWMLQPSHRPLTEGCRLTPPYGLMLWFSTETLLQGCICGHEGTGSAALWPSPHACTQQEALHGQVVATQMNDRARTAPCGCPLAT